MEIVTTIIVMLLAMSCIVQFLVDRIKAIIPQAATKYITPPLLSVCISVLLAFMFELDIFAAMGWFTRYTWLAQLLTGLAISAGADPLHNLFSKIREMREVS